MTKKKLLSIKSVDQAQLHIVRFQREVAAHPKLQARMSFARAWYGERNKRGAWQFAPSKFVGYDYATAEDYLLDSGKSGDRDGRTTEHILAQWYSAIEPGTALGRQLANELDAFLAQFGKRPNTAARISVLKAELDATPATRRAGKSLFTRISTDPQICGGRPCIRGTRIRVSDLVTMMAEGASRSDILADYDFITDDDLSAALAYVAEGADHRVIRAA